MYTVDFTAGNRHLKPLQRLVDCSLLAVLSESTMHFTSGGIVR